MRNKSTHESMRSASGVLVMACCFSALAYEPERAVNNMAHELAICSAYFTLLAELKGLSDKTKASYSEWAFQMYAGSSSLTNKKAASARLEMALKDMSKELDGKSENWSILLNQYSDSCKATAANPEARMKYWLEKKD